MTVRNSGQDPETVKRTIYFDASAPERHGQDAEQHTLESRSSAGPWSLFKQREFLTQDLDFSSKSDATVHDQSLLRCAFAFSAGILLYLALPQEPDIVALALVTVPVAMFAIRAHVVGKRLGGRILIALLLTGALTGAIRTTVVDAPRLAEPRTLTLTGLVLERLETGRGARLVVQVDHFDRNGRFVVPGTKIGGGQLPERVRLSIPDTSHVRVGDGVTIRARLFPPSGPVRPGGYDFAFWSYFKGIGAIGFAFGEPRIVPLTSGPWKMGLKRYLAGLRSGIGERIRSLLPAGDGTELVVALLIGERGGLSEKSEEDLRAAGLAHVLAISGLHMALFAGGTFAGVLFILSLFEGITLKIATQKWAAAAALCAALLYLLISGASIATQRSFIMIALVFLGMMVSRRGLSLHSVALAAFALLFVGPEQLLHPGFQMSFAAVICLVAVYGGWRTSRFSLSWSAQVSAAGYWSRIAMKVLGFLAGLAVTAVVAGAATGIIGAHHFGRYAPLGLLGNMLGMPVFSLIIMPAGVLAFVLMPFGLSIIPLKVMIVGLDLLLYIAQWTAELGQGLGRLEPPSPLTALLLMLTLFLVLLGRHWRERVVAAPLGLLAALLFYEDRPPDVQISETGERVAARDQHGDLRFSTGRRSFETEIWLQREGLAADWAQLGKMTQDQRRCDRHGCVVEAYPRKGPPVTIAMPVSAAALERDCQLAQIIVTDLSAPTGCAAALVIDGTFRKKAGALSFWLDQKPYTDLIPIKGNGWLSLSMGDEADLGMTWSSARGRPPRPWHK